MWVRLRFTDCLWEPQNELGELPAAVHEPACSAEFMVSRERVKARSLDFYVNALYEMQVGVLSPSLNLLAFRPRQHDRVDCEHASLCICNQ